VPAETFNLTTATEWSSNIWYALAGLRTGGDNLASFAARMGFGSPLSFDLPTASSQVTTPGGPGPGGFSDQVELASASYGQAETLVTPLQMALVAATVANGGTLMKPHLVIATTGRDGTRRIDPAEFGRVIGPDEIKELAPAMQVDNPHATFPIIGALYHPPGGIIRHDAVVWGLARGADRGGAEIHQNTEVLGIDRAGDRVTAVRTNRGTIRAGQVLNCTAGWSTLINDMAGVPLPITARGRTALGMVATRRVRLRGRLGLLRRVLAAIRI